VTAESWLNNAADNSNRGKALSLYMIVQMIGIITAQALIQVGNPGGYEAFVIASILVSVSFGPILLSISPTPAFDTAKPMSLREIMRISPLGCVGMFILGGIFSAQFGMSAVYGASVGMSLSNLSIFVATFYVGALVLQYPLGWISDRMDRRGLILIVAFLGGVGSVLGFLLGGEFRFLLVGAFIIGGLSNPLYSLLIAYTNDYLDHDDMAAASGGLVFINGLGAIMGPVITGWLMEDGVFGPAGFFLFIAVLMFAMAAYAAYRATQRASIPVDETSSFAAISPTASPVAVEIAQEYTIETELEEQDVKESA
jgi:MFS family permease